mgnify:CR=1 FL=1
MKHASPYGFDHAGAGVGGGVTRSAPVIVEYEKNELADPKAIERCPTGAIVWVEGQQFADSLIELEKKVV